MFVGAVVVVTCGNVVMLNCAYDEIVDIVDDDDGKTTAASSITMPANAIMYVLSYFSFLPSL